MADPSKVPDGDLPRISSVLALLEQADTPTWSLPSGRPRPQQLKYRLDTKTDLSMDLAGLSGKNTGWLSDLRTAPDRCLGELLTVVGMPTRASTRNGGYRCLD